jgi:hypothetical protein
MKILHIDSSPLGEASASRKLTASIVETLRRANPRSTVSHRDLAAAPPAHLSGPVLQARKPTPRLRVPSSVGLAGSPALNENQSSKNVYTAAHVMSDFPSHAPGCSRQSSHVWYFWSPGLPARSPRSAANLNGKRAGLRLYAI